MKPRARDFYDLSCIASLSSTVPVGWDQIGARLAEKCAVRDVIVTSIDHVFVPELVAEVRAKWQQQLGEFLPAPLPDVDPLLAALRPRLAMLLGW